MDSLEPSTVSTPEDPKFWESLLDKALYVVIGVGAVLTALTNFRRKLVKGVKWMFTEDESGTDKIVAALSEVRDTMKAFEKTMIEINEATTRNLAKVMGDFGHDVQDIKSAQKRIEDGLKALEREVSEARRDIVGIK